MKKIIALVLTLVMLACSAAMAETAVDVTGTWYGSMAGMVLQLELAADGTYVMSFAGEEDLGVWEIEDNKLYMQRGTETETVLDMTESSLSIQSEDMEVVFTREPIAAFEAPAKVAVEDASVFAGNWVGTKAYLYGMVLDMEEVQSEMGDFLGMKDTGLVIDGTNVAVFGGEADEFVFANGHLEMIVGDEEFSLSSFVDMNEDGTITYELMGMQFFFEKAE